MPFESQCRESGRSYGNLCTIGTRRAEHKPSVRIRFRRLPRRCAHSGIEDWNSGCVADASTHQIRILRNRRSWHQDENQRNPTRPNPEHSSFRMQTSAEDMRQVHAESNSAWTNCDIRPGSGEGICQGLRCRYCRPVRRNDLRLLRRHLTTIRIHVNLPAVHVIVTVWSVVSVGFDLREVLQAPCLRA